MIFFFVYFEFGLLRISFHFISKKIIIEKNYILIF